MLESGKSGPPAPASAGYEEQLERARAQERSGNSPAALEAYVELARRDSSRREPLQGLRRLYAERGSWDAVLQVAELEIGLIVQPEERARLLSQMARIWERELGDAEQSRALLARAADERKPGAKRIAPPARREETSAPAAPTAAATAAPVTPAPAAPAASAAPAQRDEPVSAATLVQRAWLASARGDSQAALAALQEALAGSPSDIEALDMMLTVLEGAERHGEMSELLERRAALAADDATRAVVLSRLGALREKHQGDLTGARLVYERALEADAGNRAARSALQRIYRRSEAWPALRTLLEAAATQGSATDRAAASVALGTLLEQHFDDSLGAQASYQEALRLAPQDAEALEGMRRLSSAGEPAAGSARERRRGANEPAPPARAGAESAAGPGLRVGVIEHQRARGDAGRVAVLREELLHSGPDHELRLQVELASLLGAEAGTEALPHARRAAALAPHDPALLERALEAASGSGGAFAVLDLLDDLLATAQDLGTRAKLLARRGDTLADVLGWKEEAAQAWREALEADPRHAGARARLSGTQA